MATCERARDVEPEDVRWLLWIFVAGAGLATGTTGQAASCQVRLDISTNYYVVTGQTPAALLASLRESRQARTNSSFDAFTTWKIRWTYRYSNIPEGVALDNVEVTARVGVTMPRWTSSQGAPATLVQGWVRYYQGLSAHEEGHVRLVREAVTEMQKSVSALNQFESTAALSKALDRACSQAVEKAKQRERQYDAETGHGRRQGAVWR